MPNLDRAMKEPIRGWSFLQSKSFLHGKYFIFILLLFLSISFVHFYFILHYIHTHLLSYFHFEFILRFGNSFLWKNARKEKNKTNKMGKETNFTIIAIFFVVIIIIIIVKYVVLCARFKMLQREISPSRNATVSSALRKKGRF